MAGTKPDLILSGVNRGANLGEDVFYSGTVSAAMEGALASIRSIALSQRYAAQGLGDGVPFATAEALGRAGVATAARSGLRSAYAGQHQLPARRARGGEGHSHRAPGCAIMVARRSIGAAIRGDMTITGWRSAACRTSPAMTPIWTRLPRIASPSPLHLDLTHDASLAMLDAAYR